MVFNGDIKGLQWKISAQCGNQSNLMTLEALYKRTLKPAINTRRIPNTRIDTENLVWR